MNKMSIADGLRDLGIERRHAGELVDRIHSEALEVVESERASGGSLLGAVIGGAIAALVGGAIWGLIVRLTEYEIGFMAWGLGLLAGFAVLVASGGKRGISYQLVAVGSGVLGIVVGKYFLYAYIVSASWLSADTLNSFTVDFTLMFSGFDILWVGLAVYTAWRIPSGTGLELPDA